MPKQKRQNIINTKQHKEPNKTTLNKKQPKRNNTLRKTLQIEQTTQEAII